ncbi:DNA-binding protein SpoVG, partial [hydrothermal vent metagenome]
TFDDCFVVRNIKVIQGNSGFFIAMPSRKNKNKCSKCYFKNEVGSKFCSHCGSSISSHESDLSGSFDAKKEHRDIAHPITQGFRELLQKKILEAYEKDFSRSRINVNVLDSVPSN